MERYPSTYVDQQAHAPVIVQGTTSDKMLTDGSSTPLAPQQLYVRSRTTRHRLRLLLFLPPLFAVLGIALGALYNAYWSTATIVIRPLSYQQDALVSIAAVSRPTGPQQSHLRLLTAEKTSQPLHAPASGTQPRPAASASGTLTFFNQVAYQQTIPAGIVLTSATGVQVVTGAPVVVGAGNPPSSAGSAEGSAAAQQAGASGNIPAGSINLLCGACGMGITVKNLSAFGGGQDAATFSVVRQQDVDSAASQVPHLADQTLRALQGQISASERPATTPSCASRVRSDQPAGSVLAQGATISVFVTVTCSALLFTPGEARARALDRFLAQSGSYARDARFRASITATFEKAVVQGSLAVSLSFRVRGRWVFHLSGQEQRALQRKLAGLTQQQAQQLLTGFPGIAQSSVEQPIPLFPLPSDPSRIRVEMGSAPI